MCPADEFDGIFDNLSAHNFDLRTTITFPADITDFGEFVHVRLEMTRLAYQISKAGTGSLTHAVLSNDREVCQLVPAHDEMTVRFLARLARHARSMRAHSFYFCRITESATTLDSDTGFSVLWIASHLADGEVLQRSGAIPINLGELGEVMEAPENADLGPGGEPFARVLQYG